MLPKLSPPSSDVSATTDAFPIWEPLNWEGGELGSSSGCFSRKNHHFNSIVLTIHLRISCYTQSNFYLTSSLLSLYSLLALSISHPRPRQVSLHNSAIIQIRARLSRNPKAQRGDQRCRAALLNRLSHRPREDPALPSRCLRPLQGLRQSSLGTCFWSPPWMDPGCSE